MDEFPEQLMGGLARRFHRFPLLLKFLDVHKMLSVQVHPADDRKDLLPPGEAGKTEAWGRSRSRLLKVASTTA